MYRSRPLPSSLILTVVCSQAVRSSPCSLKILEVLQDVHSRNLFEIPSLCLGELSKADHQQLHSEPALFNSISSIRSLNLTFEDRLQPPFGYTFTDLLLFSYFGSITLHPSSRPLSIPERLSSSGCLRDVLLLCSFSYFLLELLPAKFFSKLYNLLNFGTLKYKPCQI